ncbi:MAG TPA: crossover junction endodeoxyribonuclease RuvC [Candidatus Atribacteria bacterium]|nr:crossover junction endodeoxyribonuclease RuvC [Candidatus Atribacteria bacterium]HPT79405.1 crossover junction endodeoxyribonuclease RuvC [Candidatus Atribacteria bacterium]
MRVLGIDPGMAIMGYGVVEDRGNSLKVLDYGVITTSPDMETPQRLLHIYNSAAELIKRYSPDAAALEELFFNKNAKTAIIIGHARGAAVVACAGLGIDLYEYTPLQVKQSVVGYGRADKHQVQQMVKLLLNLKDVPRPDDAADALAVAVCHIHSSQMGRKLGDR